MFELAHPAGAVPVIAQPYRFSETPCRYEAPPLLGQHAAQVLTGLLGYDQTHIDELAAQGAIGLGASQ